MKVRWDGWNCEYVAYGKIYKFLFYPGSYWIQWKFEDNSFNGSPVPYFEDYREYPEGGREWKRACRLITKHLRKKEMI